MSVVQFKYTLPPPVYDHATHQWTGGQCPHGTDCTGCDPRGYCTLEESERYAAELRTPTCPCCTTKFPHDKAHPDTCKVCGIPDYIVRQGARNVARWKHKNIERLPTNQRPAGKTQPRQRKKHGRRTR